MGKCKGLGDLCSMHKRNVTFSLICCFQHCFHHRVGFFFFCSFWDWCQVVKISSWFHEMFLLSFANKSFGDIFFEIDKAKEISLSGELLVEIEGICKIYFKDLYHCFLIPPQGLSEAWMMRKHLITTIYVGHWIIAILHHVRFFFRCLLDL